MGYLKNLIPKMALLAGMLSAAAQATEVSHSINPETRIESWVLRHQGVEVELMQISPDQARAFFLARGFRRPDVEYYAKSCVFMTLVRNYTKNDVTYDLAEWRYAPVGQALRKLKLKDDWLREWKRRGASPSSLIAFEWSQHPTRQTLEASDWNQGMTTYQLPRGSKFDLRTKWTSQGIAHDSVIPAVRCAS